MTTVPAYLSIGDFSRATHMTVKTLRHYHDTGLLPPADIDPQTGYRRYTPDQIPTAQVIRRFRALDMPLDEIHAVLSAPDLPSRNELINTHLARLEHELGRTQQAVASLRALLEPPASDPHDEITLRSTPAVHAAAITDVANAQDSVTWLQGALGELFATVTAQRLSITGPAGGFYSDDVFTQHRGQATVFLPCTGNVRPIGRVVPCIVPAAELAVVVHSGPPSELDRAYGTLAAHVARHALAVDGPVREYYLVGQRDTSDSSLWRTEIGWPIFHTQPVTES